MLNWIKQLFGSAPEPTPVPESISENLSREPKKKKPATKYTRSNVSAKKYYKRNGNYYDREDDSIIEDAILLVILMDMFDAGEIDDTVNMSAPEPTEPEEDILDLDVSEMEVITSEESYSAPEPVRETYTPPVQESYSAPEPVRESAGSSYSSGSDSSSSYDSGSSDCGGGCD